MDIFSVAGTCLRRWYVTLPILALAAWLAAQAYAAVPSVYTSSVSIAVLPGTTPVPEEVEGVEPIAPNPYSGSGGPRFAAAVLARNMNTEAYRERAGLGDVEALSYEANSARDQPIISIEASASTPEAVLHALDSLTGEAEVVLAEFQTTAGAPEITQYRISPAVPPDRVEETTPSRWRATAAIIVLGGGFAAAAAVALDAGLARLRSRRAAQPDDEAPAAGEGIAADEILSPPSVAEGSPGHHGPTEPYVQVSKPRRPTSDVVAARRR